MRPRAPPAGGCGAGRPPRGTGALSRKRKRRRRRPKVEARYVVEAEHLPISAPASLAGLDPDATPEELFWFVVRRAVDGLLCVPMTPAEVARELGIPRADARMWLARLESDGSLIRTGGKRPAFVARQTVLFAETALGGGAGVIGSRVSADRIHAAFRFLASELAYPPVGAAEIAAELGVTKRYAGRCLRRLVKEGSLKTVKGRNG